MNEQLFKEKAIFVVVVFADNLREFGVLVFNCLPGVKTAKSRLSLLLSRSMLL